MPTEKTRALTARDRRPEVGDVIKHTASTLGGALVAVEPWQYGVEFVFDRGPGVTARYQCLATNYHGWQFISRADGGPITTTDDESG